MARHPHPGKARPHAELRQSQLLTTYGPGALVDLPKQAVIISGLDHWRFGKALPREVREDRLLEYLRRAQGMEGVRLCEPPSSQDVEHDMSGVVAFQFPEWFVVQSAQTWGEGVRSRRVVHLRELSQGKLVVGKTKLSVTPMRFVRACVHGHISDVDWRGLVHQGQAEACYGELYMDERETSGDLSGVMVRCAQCKRSVSLSQLASKRGGALLGPCDGSSPWLGADARQECLDERGSPVMSRLLTRSASNAYFAQVVRVISIPEPGDERLQAALEPVWGALLVNVKDRATFDMMASVAPMLQQALQGVDLDAAWAEIERRHAIGAGAGQAASQEPSPTLKQSELKTLMSQPFDLSDQPPPKEAHFWARTLVERPAPSGLLRFVERVVLVHKLREVSAQIGFTRFESGVTDVEGELDLNVRMAPLARELRWLPAVENHGEGIFVALDRARVARWLERQAVQARGAELEQAFDRWRSQRQHTRELEFPGLPYVMVHSLSHLLLTAVALECGYSASSIRERVYASPEGYGVLLYTASADSEGTLGGLVEVGRHLEVHLQAALHLGSLCSNDPVCAQHDPLNEALDRPLHGAACHGCLLISETSCERRNELLDRALVVPTVSHDGCAFFDPRW